MADAHVGSVAELVHVVAELPDAAAFVAVSEVGTACQAEPVQKRPSLLRLRVNVTASTGMPVAPVTASAAEPVKLDGTVAARYRVAVGLVTDAVTGSAVSDEATSSTLIPISVLFVTVRVWAPQEDWPPLLS